MFGKDTLAAETGGVHAASDPAEVSAMVVDLKLPEQEFKRVVDATVDATVDVTKEVTPIFRYLLTPVALAGYVLAAWRLSSDVGWTEEFFIQRGLLSHWQVWLALALGVQLSAGYLDRLRARENGLQSGTATP